MRTAWSAAQGVVLLCLFIGSHTPLSGCNDDSKTSGTQVAENPEAKAHRKAKGESYKGGPPRNRPRAPVRRGSRSRSAGVGQRILSLSDHSDIPGVDLSESGGRISCMLLVASFV